MHNVRDRAARLCQQQTEPRKQLAGLQLCPGYQRVCVGSRWVCYPTSLNELVTARAVNAPPVAQVGLERLVAATIEPCVVDVGERVPDLDVGIESAFAG